jgi:hypothetical protein
VARRSVGKQVLQVLRLKAGIKVLFVYVHFVLLVGL